MPSVVLYPGYASDKALGALDRLSGVCLSDKDTDYISALSAATEATVRDAMRRCR